MRRNEIGKMNLFTLFLLAGLAVAIYSAAKFVPVYIEKSRISRLVEQATNSWANVTPQLRQVRKELQYNLDVGQVTSITEQDVNFAKLPGKEVQGWVEYEVVIHHPYDIIQPTVLEFFVEHTTEASLGLQD